jgi:hypothetical protein
MKRKSQDMMEAVDEDIVIVGAGIAGLTTSLGLHRYPRFLPLFSCVFKILNKAYIYIYIYIYIYVVGWEFEA